MDGKNVGITNLKRGIVSKCGKSEILQMFRLGPDSAVGKKGKKRCEIARNKRKRAPPFPPQPRLSLSANEKHSPRLTDV